MDIIVTTPKSQMLIAKQEAENCIADGGGEYFRRFPSHRAPKINIGERVFYVEDGYIRGYAYASRVFQAPRYIQCDTTGRWWGPGFYVIMPADSWRWIRPIPMRGFQGYRYVCKAERPGGKKMLINSTPYRIVEVGGWRDPRPGKVNT